MDLATLEFSRLVIGMASAILRDDTGSPLSEDALELARHALAEYPPPEHVVVATATVMAHVLAVSLRNDRFNGSPEQFLEEIALKMATDGHPGLES